METPTPPSSTHSIGDPSNPSPTVALEMRDVTVGSMKYADRIILEHVNWSVRVGDYWAIGGLQATGKSDLLATAAGLMRPSQGSYQVFGQELATGYEHELLNARLRVGLVFDGGRLLQHITVAENILLPLRYHQQLSSEELESRLRALLELIGLMHQATSYPNSLALNWQQRVGLARALTLKPEVLLLDNPLTGLDPVHTAWWHKTLDKLHAGDPILENRPLILVVTGDDLRPWRPHARQFAILKDKRFVPLNIPPGETLPEDAALEQLWGGQPEAGR